MKFVMTSYNQLYFCVLALHFRNGTHHPSWVFLLATAKRRCMHWARCLELKFGSL